MRGDIVCLLARYTHSTLYSLGSHWPTHKKSCQPFLVSNTVTLKPSYRQGIQTVPLANFTRAHLGIPTQHVPSHSRSAHTTKSLSSKPKVVVIKVQVPYDPFNVNNVRASVGDLLVYTKKRDFVCTIQRAENQNGYDIISQVVRSKGVGGAKAYFVAELKNKDELVVKVSEVLAEQPF